jgi:hypothetical protein
LSLERATDEQREGVLTHLRTLVGRGAIDLEHFEVLSSVAIGAVSVADLADVMAKVPPIVAMTAPGRELTEPLVLRVTTGSLKMNGRWQVGAETKATVATGSMVLDFTDAELDDIETSLTLRVATGSMKVIIPQGIDVQLVGIGGSVKNALGTSLAPPGSPLLRIDANCVTGSIHLRRPKAKKQRWWRRRRDDDS